VSEAAMNPSLSPTSTTHVVTQVRKELSADGTHEHIAGVCTQDGTYHTRREVVERIRAGETWMTSAAGYEAEIEPIVYCPQPNCLATPYIRTRPYSTRKDNIENLDPC
jgi:Protein of unknown function (DUF3892)